MLKVSLDYLRNMIFFYCEKSFRVNKFDLSLEFEYLDTFSYQNET